MGCLWHHPITVLLTGIALIFWLAELVNLSIYLLAGQRPNLVSIMLTSLLVLMAQLTPRLVSRFGPPLWRAFVARRAAPLDRTTIGALDTGFWRPLMLHWRTHRHDPRRPADDGGPADADPA
jgi:hypothetical protein